LKITGLEGTRAVTTNVLDGCEFSFLVNVSENQGGFDPGVGDSDVYPQLPGRENPQVSG
jgi:hypothetical protein